jgi:AcrR family transcriptional regulator
MKSHILEQAQKTFKIKGLHKTTMRDIAQALAVSDGHVRYYFRTKEDLLVALFDQMNAEILSISQSRHSDDLRESLRLNLQQSFRIMTLYDFFFLESIQSLKLFPELFKSYTQLFGQRRLFFEELFTGLKQQGVFKPSVTEEQLGSLFEQFFILSDSWMRAHYLQHTTEITEKEILHYSELSLQLFLPYFSETV